MKNLKIALGFILAFCLLIFSSWFIYKQFIAQKEPPLYSTGKPTVRSIEQIIKATGYTEVKDMMKIGSLVSGVLDKMFLEENDMVKKGQLLALVDDGKGETLVKQARAALKSAQGALYYIERNYQRQKKLFDQEHISQDSFDKIYAEHQVASAQVDRAQSALEEAELQFNNKRIVAPDDGIVIQKVSSEGETVTLSAPPTLIYTIAKDITKMEVKLEVDETVVGKIKIGDEAVMTLDTYANKKFTGTVKKISNAPKTVGGAVSYLATIELDNRHRLFRPGMTVNSEILVGRNNKTVAIPTNILKIKRSMIESIAEMKEMEYKPLSEEQLRKIRSSEIIKTVWAVEKNAFIEKPISIGITDDAYYEVTQGLDGSEHLVVDTIEPDTMKEFFEQFFGKGLTE